MKNCITCEHGEVKQGICCPTCGHVLNIMAVIKHHWEPDELTKLRDTLREESVKVAHKAAIDREASVMAKLLWHIIAAAGTLKIHPDTMRSKVCDGINDEIKGIEAIRKHDEKQGEGDWNRLTMNFLQKWVGDIDINKKQPATVQAR